MVNDADLGIDPPAPRFVSSPSAVERIKRRDRHGMGEPWLRLAWTFAVDPDFDPDVLVTMVVDGERVLDVAAAAGRDHAGALRDLLDLRGYIAHRDEANLLAASLVGDLTNLKDRSNDLLTLYSMRPDKYLESHPGVGVRTGWLNGAPIPALAGLLGRNWLGYAVLREVGK